MTYRRVIPRDFFNESKLLKCLGKLSVFVLDGRFNPTKVEEVFDGKPFDVRQDESSGDIFLINHFLIVNGKHLTFRTSLNSLSLWPLYCDEIEVLTDKGVLTKEFLEYVKGL